MKLSKISAAILTALSTQTIYAETSILDKVFVSDSLILDNELSSTYSTQHFTQTDFEQSGATTLSEFLAQNSSTLIKPSFGNPLSPRMDIGAFGMESGFENVQIIVNGVSLKNLDMVPAQLSTIDINSIKKLSIIQGSGSVLYGNGSAGGAIIIETLKGKEINSGARISSKYSSDNQQIQSIGIQKTIDYNQYQYFTNFSLQTHKSDGQFKVKSDGSKNTIDHLNLAATIGIANENSEADIQITKTQTEVVYPGHLSLSDFNNNPTQDQTNGNALTLHQLTSQLHLKHKLNKKTKIDYTVKSVNKDSKTFSRYDYEQVSHNLDLKTKGDKTILLYGIKLDKNQRIEDKKQFSINTQAAYASAKYQANKSWLLDAGLRYETLGYQYKDSINTLNKTENLANYNFGANYKINNNSAAYINLNHALTSPAIDHFFKWNATYTSQEFNGFIDTQTSDTLTIGYKADSKQTNITIEAFSAKLSNEFFLDKYLDPWGIGINTSIDKSSKQGVNLRLKQSYNQAIIGLDYKYQIAKIDKNSATNLTGKTVPGVPEHIINIFTETFYQANWMPLLKEHRINASYKVATESYALSDFKNEYGKYSGYESADITYTMNNKNFSLKMGINNLLDKVNGTYVYKGNAPKGIVVYPENTGRSWFIQAELKI